MKQHRFYVSQNLVPGENHIENAELIHQWRRVLRFEPGSKLLLFTPEAKEYEGQIVSLAAASSTVYVTELNKGLNPSKEKLKSETVFHLAAALLGKGTYETVVQKATELGVSKIFPIIAARSVKRTEENGRLVKIAIEASEQSGRVTIPKIENTISFVEMLDLPMTKILFDMQGEKTLHDIDLTNAKEILACVGPEGGWTGEEITLAKAKGVPVVSLGDMTLRADTAAIASLVALRLVKAN